MLVSVGEFLNRLPFPVSKPTLYRWLRNGLIPSIRIGGKIFVEDVAIDEILESRCSGVK